MMKTRLFSFETHSSPMGFGKTRSMRWKAFSTVAPSNGVKKTTILDIQKKFQEKLPITMVTAYDYTSAIAVDRSGVDMILVGDSAGMVMMGLESTTQVTMEDMIHHCKSVKRGAKRAFVVGDMPFGSYEISPIDAVKNATRLIKEGQVEAVKMEGGKRIKEQIKAVVNAGIPVVGHIGLTPQTTSSLGGFKVQGRTAAQAKLILEDALELEACGVSAIVIESVPAPVAEYITKQLNVPTIGIGAGVATSGQVLVYHDMLGLYTNFVPKFSKQYLSLAGTIQSALEDFRKEVENRVFPSPAHSYTIKEEELMKAFPDATSLSTLNSNKEKTEQPNDTSKTQTKSAPLVSSTPLKEKKKTVAIIGGGSMGSLLGGRLAAAGDSNIWMVSSWKEHVDKINRTGLTLQNIDKSKQTISLNATTDVEEVLKKVGGVDLAVVMVKSPQTREAAEKAAKLIHSKGFVLTLQNGMGNKEIISQVLGDPSKVIQGVTSHGGNIVESGYVIHTGAGATSLGMEMHNSQIIREIAEMLNRAGFVCELNDNLESMMWGKLIVNSAINPLSAILRVRNGVLVESGPCRDLLVKTVKEGVTVANARGIALPFDNPTESVLAVARATKDNVSSMLRDVMRGTQTEIDAINGVIVREGDRLGVEVFLNRTMIGLLQMQNPVGAKQALQILSV